MKRKTMQITAAEEELSVELTFHELPVGLIRVYFAGCEAVLFGKLNGSSEGPDAACRCGAGVCSKTR
jgi:hypothetical protein